MNQNESVNDRPADGLKPAVPSFSLSQKLHSMFPLFGSIALLLGVLFTACFYKAGIGISYPVYVIFAVFFLQKTADSLRNCQSASTDEELKHYTITAPEKKRSLKGIPYDVAAMLVALSTVYTDRTFFHFFSTIGILLLLECAFLAVLFDGQNLVRSFSTRLSELFLVPLAALANFPYAIIDSCSFLKRTRLLKNEKARQILLGIVIAVPLLIIVLSLLASADMIFSHLTGEVLSRIFRSADPVLILLQTLLIFICLYSFFSGAAWLFDYKNKATGQEKPLKASPSLTAITVSTLLTVIYLIFCGIQVIYLFGAGNVTLPADYTYAEYARQGFFQLLAVTLLNILIVLLCLRASESSPVLKAVLTVMSACTYIMIASAGMRMLLYVSAYDLSFLRILVLWFLVVNTFLMTGALLTIYRPGFPLFRYCVAVVSVSYILLVFSRPDNLIASYNLSPERDPDKVDTCYLSELSSDAAPVLLEELHNILQNGIPQHNYNDSGSASVYQRYLALSDYRDRIYSDTKDNGFRGYNISRARALTLLKEYDLLPEEKSSPQTLPSS